MNHTDTHPVDEAIQPSQGGAAAKPSRLPKGLRTWGGRALIAIAAGSTLVWIGAIAYGAFVDYELAGWLDNREFPEVAEPICEAAMDEVAAFPPARLATSPEDRAVEIRQSTAIIEQMIEDLRPLVPNDEDTEWVNLWLDDWGIHIADRLDFADRLETGGAREEFFETTKADAQISKSLDHFAEVNKMESCTTPGDV